MPQGPLLRAFTPCSRIGSAR